MDYIKKYNVYKDIIEKNIERAIEKKDTDLRNLYEAMEYSLVSKAKRIRPVLMLAAYEMLGGKTGEILDFALAVEMIHTYSLIHDDLPSMDDDDLRRGRPSNHKVYGEAKAILAGDALLNLSYETILKSLENNFTKGKIKAACIIAEAAGIDGMIGGQVIDIEIEGMDPKMNIIDKMQRKKTGALIKASVLAGAYMMNACKKDIKALNEYACNIGTAFQIRDDILDVTGRKEILGKNTGSDLRLKKATCVSKVGIEESQKRLFDVTDKAVKALEVFGSKASFLKKTALYIADREK